MRDITTHDPHNDTPLALIDIDGVANAFGARMPYARHHHGRVAGKYYVIIDDRHPEWMAEIEERAEMRWATMWEQFAAIDFAPVAGFGRHWDYVDFTKHHEIRGASRSGMGVVHYKWAGILEVAGDRPLVYVDDDMAREHHAWARRRDAAGIPTLFVQPDPRTGYTRGHHDAVTAFLDRVALSRAA